MDYIKLTNESLSLENVTDLIKHSSCGALSFFVGTTRDNFEGKLVKSLYYEAYEDMARKRIIDLCKKCRSKWNLKHIAVFHRLGTVGITEASIIIGVSSVHRKDSLQAVSFLIDNIKATVPIWKKESYENSDSEWKQNTECWWTKPKRMPDDLESTNL